MKSNKLKIAFIFIALIQFSCKKFLKIEAPKDSLIQASIFQNDDIAASAVEGIYYNMYSNGFASGSATSIATLCGLSADEFKATIPVMLNSMKIKLHQQTAHYQIIYTWCHTSRSMPQMRYWKVYPGRMVFPHQLNYNYRGKHFS